MNKNDAFEHFYRVTWRVLASILSNFFFLYIYKDLNTAYKSKKKIIIKC